MKYLLTLILFGALLTSCSFASTVENATQEVPSGNRNIASVATEGKVTEEVATQEANAGVVMTVDPTPVILKPIQGNITIPDPTPTPYAHEGWQTFTSATLGIAVDYPADWTMTEQTDGATFTSPQAATIKLKTAKTSSNNNETRIGNQRCTSRTNAYSLTADICVDSISFSYSAKFLLPNGNEAQWLSLTTTTRTIGAVFEAMFNSVRLTK
jgi:hypothetical protein